MRDGEGTNRKMKGSVSTPPEVPSNSSAVFAPVFVNVIFRMRFSTPPKNRVT